MKKLIRLLLIFIIGLFAFRMPAKAENTEYVRDDYGLLSSDEVDDLNTYAAEIASKYNCGVYVRVFSDMGSYYNIEDFAESVYKAEDMGLGSEKNGVMIILSMDERDYDILAYGDQANSAFTDYAKELMVQRTVPQMSNGDFYNAFRTFITIADEDLYALENGQPVDEWIPDDYIEEDPEVVAQRQENMRRGVSGVSSIISSLLICLGLRSKNKTAAIATEAKSYIPKGGIRLTKNQDLFLYRNQTVTHVQRNNDGGGGGGHWGGTSVNSGGFSHSSGKF